MEAGYKITEDSDYLGEVARRAVSLNIKKQVSKHNNRYRFEANVLVCLHVCSPSKSYNTNLPDDHDNTPSACESMLSESAKRKLRTRSSRRCLVLLLTTRIPLNLHLYSYSSFDSMTYQSSYSVLASVMRQFYWFQGRTCLVCLHFAVSHILCPFSSLSILLSSQDPLLVFLPCCPPVSTSPSSFVLLCSFYQ